MEEENPNNNVTYEFGPFRIETTERRLMRAGEPVPLARKSFELLLILVAAAGHVKTREELIEALWPRSVVEEQNLTVKMYALRKALDDRDEIPKYIETVRGLGYRFIASVKKFPTPDVLTQAAYASPSPWRRRRYQVGIAIFALALAAATVLSYFATGFFGKSHAHGAAPVIAVMPFDNLIPDKRDAYLTDAIQEEILTRLAAMHNLKVIARTSTELYRNHPANIETVARELGATDVVEGSVRKDGGQLHVDIRLIDGRNDRDVWAHGYNSRDLVGMFDTEGEIVHSIAASLHVGRSNRGYIAAAKRPTDNPAAYKAYLLGLNYATRAANSLQNYADAARYFKQAVERDPRFALAWARLSLAQTNMYFFGYDRTAKRLSEARDAASKALRLAPSLGEAWLAEGEYLMTDVGDDSAGLHALQTAYRRQPNNAEVLNHISYLLRYTGHWRKALIYQSKAAKLDPRNPRALYQWGLTYVGLREFTAARRLFRRVLNLTPNDEEVKAIEAATYQAQGNLVAAGRVLKTLPVRPRDFHALCVQIDQLLFRRQYKKVVEATRSALAHPDPAWGDGVGYLYALMGLAQRRLGDAAGARATYTRGRSVLAALHGKANEDFWLVANLGIMEAGLGLSSKAQADAEKALALASESAPYEPAMLENLARTEIMLGNREAALAIIPNLMQKPFGRFMDALPLTPALLRLDPTWNPIRKDPRFQALLKRRPAIDTPSTSLAAAATSTD